MASHHIKKDTTRGAIEQIETPNWTEGAHRGVIIGKDLSTLYGDHSAWGRGKKQRDSPESYEPNGDIIQDLSPKKKQGKNKHNSHAETTP